MRTLYFDCFSGASGDMILGALIDAGAQVEEVRAELDRLGIAGWSLDVENVTRGGLRATRAVVEEREPQPSRTYRDIRALIEASDLSNGVASRAVAVFRRLAEAEGRVHGTEPDDVHFHEVGGVDALIDIVGSCAAFAQLDPERVVTSPLTTGRGVGRSEHGTIPIPAPAVTELLIGATLMERGDAESITPTGAALVAEFSDDFGQMPAMRLLSTGYGAGSRDTELPNVVRVMLGEAVAESDRAERVLVAETNIDDMNPELLPHVIETLIASGAQDAWITPIVMKKGRPAYKLSTMFAENDSDRIIDVIYRETTTLGVRVHTVDKDELLREWIEVDVEGHPVRVKIGRRAGDIVTASPEYEDAASVARATGMALKDVYATATGTAHRLARQS